jgi:hypothetical protein
VEDRLAADPTSTALGAVISITSVRTCSQRD